jgi:hypothetical protein
MKKYIESEEFVVTLQKNFRQRDLETVLECFNFMHPQFQKKASCEFYKVGKMLIFCEYRAISHGLQNQLNFRHVAFEVPDFA